MPAPVSITTPIYYVNDRPHIGHAYTTTLCDVYARFMRHEGRDVFFLTGTDEHGAKVEKSAAEHGVDPQTWADRNAAEFQRVMSIFALTNDDFIRTTEPRHVVQVQRLVAELRRRDAVYLGRFEGWYDEGQEEYHTDTKAKELGYVSPVSGKPMVRATEDNYYFRLSAFQSRLEALYAERPDFVRPEARRNEVLGRLRDGLQDVPVSRTNFRWGIPMPGDEQHVIYVWIDALFNYVTALGLGEEHPQHPERRRFWPATYHVMGKEILWFHAVIWPALLMALDLPLPGCVYAHSFWIADGQKMSKSLGNFIDLEAIQGYHATYGLDAWRWFMVTRGPLKASDSDFSAAAFHDVYTTELVNTVGNCASRVTAMVGKYFDGRVPADGAMAVADHDWPGICAEAVARSTAAMEQFDLAAANEAAIGLLRRVDVYINQTEPFKIAKDPARRDELAAILYRCAEAVRIAALLLEPTMPRRMTELLEALGTPRRGTLAEAARWGGLSAGAAVNKVALFPRVERASTA